MTAQNSTSRDVEVELAFLTRALKAPSLREAFPRLVEPELSCPSKRTWSGACNARSPRVSATAVKAASARPGSRPVSR